MQTCAVPVGFTDYQGEEAGTSSFPFLGML